jgi:hypothetical protein
MPVQIDHMETSVDIKPPVTPATPRDRGAAPAAVPPALRDAVLQVLSDEFESFSRMRGH